MKKRIKTMKKREEERVPFPLAIKLKKAGFNWEVQVAYMADNFPPKHISVHAMDEYVDVNTLTPEDIPTCSAPSYTIATKWLREKKGIALNIIAHDGGQYTWEEVYLPNFKEPADARWEKFRTAPYYPTYEAALDAGLNGMLNLLIGEE